MLAASGRLPVARWRRGYEDEPPGRASAVPGPQRDAAQCGRSSLPAKISLHLIPGDIGTFLCHRCVEGLGVFGILQPLDQLLVPFRTDQHRCRPAVALEEHRFSVGRLHRLREVIPSFADCHLCHTDYCTRCSINLYRSPAVLVEVVRAPSRLPPTKCRSTTWWTLGDTIRTVLLLAAQLLPSISRLSIHDYSKAVIQLYCHS